MMEPVNEIHRDLLVTGDPLMNLINRVVIILLLVLLIPTLLFVILASAFPGPLIGPLVQGLSALENPTLGLRIVAIVVAAILLVIVLGFLLLEFRRSAPKTVRLQNVASGDAALTTQSIEQGLTQAISEIPEVIKVTPIVIGKSKGVEVRMDLQVSQDVDVPAMTDKVVGVARDVIERKMGLALLKIKVNMQLASSGGRRAQPASVPREY
jgi:hypothetical protein